MRAKNGVASLSKESLNHPCTVSPTDNVSLPFLVSSILYNHNIKVSNQKLIIRVSHDVIAACDFLVQSA
jgi:hypothetical protein